MRRVVPLLGFTASLILSALSWSQEPTSKPPATKTPKSIVSDGPPITPEIEAEALGFVRENHPELATVLETLKTKNPAEFGKAIRELLAVSRDLRNLKTRNPQRYELALDSWKTRSKVELLAAQLAGSPGNEELRSQLRTAMEAKIDAEIRRQQFELKQAEAAARRAREALDRLENHREAVVEARLRALSPRKTAKSKKPADSRPATPPNSTAPASNPIASPPNGEDRS